MKPIKSFRIVLFILLFSTLFQVENVKAASADSLIYFNGSFNEALAQSKQIDKPIMVLFTTSWCGYCKKFENTTLKNTDVISFINSNFILFEQNAESADGKKMASSFGVGSYPTIIFLDANAKPLLTSEGFHEVNDLLQLMKSVSKK